MPILLPAELLSFAHSTIGIATLLSSLLSVGTFKNNFDSGLLIKEEKIKS
jgi:hypothetical protein